MFEIHVGGYPDGGGMTVGQPRGSPPLGGLLGGTPGVSGVATLLAARTACAARAVRGAGSAGTGVTAGIAVAGSGTKPGRLTGLSRLTRLLAEAAAGRTGIAGGQTALTAIGTTSG